MRLLSNIRNFRLIYKLPLTPTVSTGWPTWPASCSIARSAFIYNKFIQLVPQFSIL